METERAVESVLGTHPNVREDPSRRELIAEAISQREAWVSESGALATWTPPDSTGRRPQDTYIVDRSEIHGEVDWTSPYCLPMSPDTFDMILEDALVSLGATPRLFTVKRALGADPQCALTVRLITDRALTALFADNMFRPLPQGAERSAFAERPFTLLALPYGKLDPEKYTGRLRVDRDRGSPSDVAVVMDFAHHVGIVYGSAYLGSVKKLLFTVMNFFLPPLGILPLHGAANVDPSGNSALFLGLSGTGKTSLSSDPERALLGDDEHGWSSRGIFNFEWGCYAKMIDLDPAKEPDIYHAVMHNAQPEEHGAIVENAFLLPNGRFDFTDRRLTENSRASYPLSFIRNADPIGRAGHPSAMVFLTADAHGVLPPLARLEPDQAMLWFLMGYTSKLAGTETGVVVPGSTFSRFFGAPFMPRLPSAYTGLLGTYLDRYHTQAWLVNTGWSGGPYGLGARIDIRLTRRMVRAALSGELDTAEFTLDERFHVWVPDSCPGVPQEMLQPETTWNDRTAYARRADLLAGDFASEYAKAFGRLAINPRVAAQCPGRP